MSDWKEGFKILCRIQDSKDLDRLRLPDMATIAYKSELACTKCRAYGIYLGERLEIGHLYKTACAEYCPLCEHVNVISEDYNTYWDSAFLKTMKAKLLGNISLLSSTRENGRCPVCGCVCRSYEADLGGINYYLNTWTVCINPDCYWEGGYTEVFETGPY